jgi:DNA adenine methylase
MNGSYYELFAGGLSVLFELQPKRSVVCDTLIPIVNLYTVLQSNIGELKYEISKLPCKEITKEIYYEIRERYNDIAEDGSKIIESSALFLFLNKSSFNALWRLNKEGIYNVPYGNHKSITLPTSYDMLQYCSILQNTEIIHIMQPKDIFKIIHSSESGDVIFADPPYYKTFDNYDGMSNSSSKEFHEQLSNELQTASNKGVGIIITNNNTPETRKWYGEFCHTEIISKTHVISGKNEGRKQWNQILAVSF